MLSVAASGASILTRQLVALTGLPCISDILEDDCLETLSFSSNFTLDIDQ